MIDALIPNMDHREQAQQLQKWCRMQNSVYQSPISPGVSWYEATVGERPTYPALDGSRKADVVVIGGGFTGLQAACHLAKAGVNVVLIEAHRLGDGGSGRNGGQLGTGQRAWPEEMEAEFGFERAKALFDMAENAKHHVLNFARDHQIDIDYLPGQMNLAHKTSYLKDYQASVEIAANRFGYTHMHYMDAAETAERVGSKRFFGGVMDRGTGHIHPMKLLAGLGRAAQAAGAQIFETTPASAISRSGSHINITTPSGVLTADRVLIACNSYINGLEPVTSSHVMPIGSFIGATVPLDDFPEIIPGKEAVADSRFVVRYFRKTADNRLLFGGREIYSPGNSGDMEKGIRRQITEVYPQLADVKLTHAWGGYVGITLPRQPFVREVMPGVTSIGGYSGHGVMLSNYCGKLYADMVLGNTTELELLRSLKIPAFPGGSRLRSPLLFLALSWYALRDRF
jgi:gamma-glutamylputrescine oxidase